MCGCLKCAPSCICPCHRPPWPVRTYHLHPKTGTVHMDQASLTYSSADTCPVYEKRAVVVIDPEGREQVERLVRFAYPKMLGEPSHMIDMLTAGLREFANPTPPKPDEPGVWSVVIVANNVPFMRVAEPHITPPLDECWFGEHPTTGERVRLSWSGLHDLGDVRVVNEATS